MDIIKFSVVGQTIIPETDIRRLRVTSDTINYFKCQFIFDNDWDGFEKRIYFKNASFNLTKSAIPDSSGYCYIPWEIIAHTGVILCNIAGIKYVDGNPVRLTAGPVKLFFQNDGSSLGVFRQRDEGTIAPDDQSVPTPTEYEQYIVRVNEAVEEALGVYGSYNNLTDKPSIEGIELEGNKSFSDLNLDVLTNQQIEDLLVDETATPDIIIDGDYLIPITDSDIDMIVS